jgi:hypothetical protein
MISLPIEESVVLCEGYHDRAFWAGLLAYLGCRDPGLNPGTGRRTSVKDPFGKTVAGGQFAFTSPNGRFLRVIPCQGKDKILGIARMRLKERPTAGLTQLVLNWDSDAPPTSSEPDASVFRSRLLNLGREFDDAAQLSESGEIFLRSPESVLSLLLWRTPDAPMAGLPPLDTLERLVCASLVAAYPARGEAVQRWLDSRPSAPPAGPKEYSWSYMAGWAAEQGCESFLRLLWEDTTVAAELKEDEGDRLVANRREPPLNQKAAPTTDRFAEERNKGEGCRRPRLAP